MREMKDSGIEWIGMIPKDWKISKIKNETILIGSGSTPTSGNLDYYENGNINWIQSGDLYNKKAIMDTSAKITEKALKEVSALNVYSKNFIVVAMYGASVGNVSISYIDACSNQACCCLKTNKNNDLNFMYYWLNTSKNYFLSNTDGGTQPNISQNKIKNHFYCVPSIDVQKKISRFLDNKCSEIDSLTKDIQQQISQIEEYKKAVITEAVTKGLNPNVEMKESSIEWVGKIPKCWEKSKLNYECYIRARLGWRGLKADEYVDEGYAFLSAFNIQENKMKWDNVNFINKQRYDESPEIKLSVGDILLVKDGAGIGKTARIDNLPLGECTTNSSLAVITPSKKLNYRYLSYYLQSSVFLNFINRVLNGMGVPHLTQEIMKSINVLIPVYDEQIEISDFLDKKCYEINSIIESKKQQLSKLEEYKKSVIYEYVTGKKEVLYYED